GIRDFHVTGVQTCALPISDFMAIGSSSTAKLNSIAFHPHVEYNVEKDTIYRLHVDIPKMKAQDFITSLPTGLFTNFEGMVAEGRSEERRVGKECRYRG